MHMLVWKSPRSGLGDVLISILSKRLPQSTTSSRDWAIKRFVFSLIVFIFQHSSLCVYGCLKNRRPMSPMYLTLMCCRQPDVRFGSDDFYVELIDRTAQ